MISPSYGIYIGAEGIEGIVFRLFGVIVNLDLFTFPGTAVTEADPKPAVILDTVYGIGKVNEVGEHGVAFMNIQPNRFFDNIQIGSAHMGDSSGDMVIHCQNLFCTNAKVSEKVHAHTSFSTVYHTAERRGNHKFTVAIFERMCYNKTNVRRCIKWNEPCIPWM
jgi:hypothetical protein